MLLGIESQGIKLQTWTSLSYYIDNSKSDCFLIEIFFNAEKSNELFVAFDNYGWMKVIGRNNQCNSRFIPKLETEDFDDMLIGWNQLCFTMAKGKTYDVIIDHQTAFCLFKISDTYV